MGDYQPLTKSERRCLNCGDAYSIGKPHTCKRRVTSSPIDTGAAPLAKPVSAAKHGANTAKPAPAKAEIALVPPVDARDKAISAPVDFRTALKAARLTQAEFARMTGTPIRTVHDWTAGESRTPSIAIAFLDLWLRSR